MAQEREAHVSAQRQLPPATAETFIAMELAYGESVEAEDVMAFLQVDMLDPNEDVGLIHWLKAYLAWKNPAEAAALEDEHLQSPAKYNPLR